ncbi:Hint domain-containing protein [Neokomagataea thailandica]|uniref:Outer membrane protein n=1 Tax=Neokomagataea tanensis NBRC 106556 TaxID=1223519 RepID=A0ABQ0QIF3_9PROT|nr:MULTISPECIES: Hint domain-containing protein [Neokomagataea]GBR45908.1 outer membrane protein [Neokomagataea tanensis NBRC 106556]
MSATKNPDIHQQIPTSGTYILNIGRLTPTDSSNTDYAVSNVQNSVEITFGISQKGTKFFYLNNDSSRLYYPFYNESTEYGGTAQNGKGRKEFIFQDKDGKYYIVSQNIINLNELKYQYDQNSNTFFVKNPNTGTNIALTGGDDDFDPCFLAGSMIETPEGYKAVETLTANDKIIVLRNGEQTVEAVRWVGKTSRTVRQGRHITASNYPVRVLKDALADGVPFKDMLITAEHCLFFNGNFVPVRMLVNNHSIFYDRSITSYTFYHVEMENHAIIIADGVLTESYLDTGNINRFHEGVQIMPLPTSRNLTWKNAAAPLSTSRDFVEPLFKNILARAQSSNLPKQAAPEHLTEEHDLHLMTEKGERLDTVRINGKHHIFHVPAGTHNIWLMSNASAPSITVGPFIDDRRTLGVLIGEVTLFEKDCTKKIQDHLHVSNLNGWHGIESSNNRWTSGQSLLPISHTKTTSNSVLSIELISSTIYVKIDNLNKNIAA